MIKTKTIIFGGRPGKSVVMLKCFSCRPLVTSSGLGQCRKSFLLVPSSDMSLSGSLASVLIVLLKLIADIGPLLRHLSYFLVPAHPLVSLEPRTSPRMLVAAQDRP